MKGVTGVMAIMLICSSVHRKETVARMATCRKLCHSHRGVSASVCVRKYCGANFLLNRISQFGKRASTTIVGVKTESEGATIDINVKTKGTQSTGLNQTAWEGLIYLTLLHGNDKRTASTKKPKPTETVGS